MPKINMGHMLPHATRRHRLRSTMQATQRGSCNKMGHFCCSPLFLWQSQVVAGNAATHDRFDPRADYMKVATQYDRSLLRSIYLKLPRSSQASNLTN